MTNEQLPQFWHISYPQTRDGLVIYEETMAQTESNARELAVIFSATHGTAKIMNRQGLFASYVMGREQKISSLKPVCMIPDCGCAGYAHP